jgi:hypothetical protein
VSNSHNARQLARYRALATSCLCTRCAAVAVAKPGQRCDACREAHNASRRAAAGLDAWRAERRRRRGVTALERHLEALSYWRTFAGTRDV